jgi:hypothetical protein
MTIASEQRRALPAGRRVGVSLLKASLIASLIFALAWLRLPLSASNFALVAVIFVGYGILIAIFAMVLGSPLVRLLERRRMNRWWSHLAAAAATGALLAAIFSSSPYRRDENCEHPGSGLQETCIENPRAIHLAFSPWTRPRPGLIEYPPIAMRDFIGSIIFGAIVGGALGISFWFFYTRSQLPSVVMRERKPQGQSVRVDPLAESANPNLPAFIAIPKGAPAYHGFPLLAHSEKEGFSFGVITEPNGETPASWGDAFAVAPDGSRAGIVWQAEGEPSPVVCSPSPDRWGVYAFRFRRSVRNEQDLIENLHEVLPQLKAFYAAALVEHPESTNIHLQTEGR